MLFSLLLFLSILTKGRANYRHYFLDNADICGQSTGKTRLKIGTGAVRFELSGPSKAIAPFYKYKQQKCEIDVEAPPGFGIIAYVEDMLMRKSSKDDSCVDYIQFGQDDRIPFYTYKKSDRLCGELRGKHNVSSGFAYDDPHGNLLIWIVLGPRSNTSMWPHIGVTRLSLIATAYKSDCLHENGNFRKCQSGNSCIWKGYFCDDHFNCAFDSQPKDELGCTQDSESGGFDTHPDLPPSHGLNLVSLVLIIVCCCLGVLLCILICFRLKRTRKLCFSSNDSMRQSCELPERPIRSLAELDRDRRDREQNIYLPLTTFLDQPILPPHHRDASEEPPPAYDELFPDGPAAEQPVFENIEFYEHIEAADVGPEVATEVVDAPRTFRDQSPEDSRQQLPGDLPNASTNI